MRLMIIRHGDPDYERDSLTEKGWREAKLLADRIARLPVKEFYVSPLGRAKDTASLTLKAMGREAVECEWLREFAPQIRRPDAPEEKHIVWDWLPQDWTRVEEYFRRDLWYTTEIMQAASSPAPGCTGVFAEYRWVVGNFDRLLAEHGYVRDGEVYRVERANRDTLVFFCHFGLECVLLSHLMHVSPMILWHNLCAAPSSVTTVCTEERRKGTADFRVNGFGDISHLYAAGEEPAFAARFCETYDSPFERRD